MAATTARLTESKGRHVNVGTFPMPANTRILKGTIVQLNATDQAIPGADGNGFRAIGKARATYDNTTGSEAGGGAGDLDAQVDYGVFGWAGEAGSLPTVGDICYVADNETVSTDSDGGARGIAGYCVEVRDSKYWVLMAPESVVANSVASTVVSKAFGFADVAALGAVASGSIDFDDALPAGAVVIGAGVNVTALFDNVGNTASVSADLGIAGGDTDAFCDGVSLDAVASVGSPAGIGMGTLVGAVTPSVLVDPDVDCDEITKGAAVAYVIYTLAF